MKSFVQCPRCGGVEVAETHMGRILWIDDHKCPVDEELAKQRCDHWPEPFSVCCMCSGDCPCQKTCTTHWVPG